MAESDPRPTDRAPASVPDRELVRLVTEAAHDIRSPLQSLVTLAELLGRTDDPTELKELAGRIRAGAALARDFAEDLLALGVGPRATADRIDVPALLDAIARAHAVRAPGTRVEVDAEALPPVSGPRNALARALANLLRNADDAMAEAGRSGTIRLEATTAGADVTIRIRDEGPGVPAELVPNLFQAGTTGRSNRGGTGLGLALVRRLVEAMGGTIALERTSDRGAVFAIHLASRPVANPERSEVEAAPPPTASLAILVVDDDPSTCEAYARLLALEGHRVDAVATGKAGLERFRSGRHDVAIVDVRMPDVAGPAFYERVCREMPDRRRAIIFATGDLLNEKTRGFLDSTGNPYLIKPFTFDALRAALNIVARR